MFDDVELYPTPREVARHMMKKIRNKDAKYFLEPEAGKGDLAEVVRGDEDASGYDDDGNWHPKASGRFRERGDRQVDCIEINPELSAILREKSFPLVGFDWLTYDGTSYYDAIVMNPPFSEGAAHLLKAWDFLHGGEIVCLLNSETIRNPYTEERQRLVKLIEATGSVEELGDCFSRAQRKTGVNVACVHMLKPTVEDTLDLWSVKTEEQHPEDTSADPSEIALRDALGNKQHYYDMANAEMLKAFQHLRIAQRYISANDISLNGDNREVDMSHILDMARGNVTAARAEFIKRHRRACWRKVFSDMKFHKWLDKKQTEELLRDVERDSAAPFTKENIKATWENVFLNRRKLFEQSVANVFDALTKHYAGNTTGSGSGGTEYSGWKSNSKYRVNRKLVFPYGCRYDSKWCNWQMYYRENEINIYNDLDRVLCVLDGQNFEDCYTIYSAMHTRMNRLEKRRQWNDRRNGYKALWSASEQCCESQYFDIRFYQKGTVHLTWKREDLWEKFNITAAAGKKWLGDRD